MNKLLKYREELNLTQQQLSDKANISVRTIQRIEAGQQLKGHTLNALSEALNVDKNKLLGIEEASEPTQNNLLQLKLINLSSLLVLIVPLGSILFPLIIMYWKKEVNKITKQIVSIQIIWTLAFPTIVLLVVFLGNIIQINRQIVPLSMLLMLMINVYIILKNTASLDKKGELSIFLNFSIL
ncbi:helix-turn-helix domain-containing protein [Aquimarina agarilytica]|uniref:helix-turn-helix domain-containing protein n=1 Tax=Aquimarina agarilytica TaxID=1087449 RepID=UPI0002894772|nr:helix-turn-helix domain-containing protein [Aquimarina agarilytica]